MAARTLLAAVALCLPPPEAAASAWAAALIFAVPALKRQAALALVACAAFFALPLLAVLTLGALCLGAAAAIGLAAGLVSLLGALTLGEESALAAAAVMLAGGAAAFAALVLAFNGLFALARLRRRARPAPFRVELVPRDAGFSG